MLIEVEGNHYVVHLNGIRVLRFTIPGAEEGLIALQLHSGGEGRMRFKDIFVRNLGGEYSDCFLSRGLSSPLSGLRPEPWRTPMKLGRHPPQLTHAAAAIVSLGLSGRADRRPAPSQRNQPCR